MALNRKPKATDNKEPSVSEQNKDFNYETQHKTIQDALDSVPSNVIDSSINNDEDKGPAFNLDMDELTEDQVDKGMTLNSPEDIKNHLPNTPRNEVVTPVQARTQGVGFSVSDDGRKEGTRPANRIDLSKLDESMILEIPEIEAATFELIGLLDPKPKDKSIRFRWANYKNNVQGNLARYYALGYSNASIDDVDQEQSPIHESMIDGTTIKYYDIMLLKIPVLRLMSLYKANIVKSVNRLIKFKERGIKEARREFNDSLSGRDKTRYNEFKSTLQKEPVEFYVPGAEESQVVGK